MTNVKSIELTGADAMEKAAKMMADLRNDIPKTIGGAQVTVVRDYRSGISEDVVSGLQTHIDLPRSNVLEFVLGNKGSVIVRPSGTEPKVKFYFTAIEQDEESAKALLNRMRAQMEK